MTTAALWLLGGAALVAQGPVRDAPSRITTGTSAISGVVVSSDAEARPIRLATVTLSGQPLLRSETATTDDAGHFGFIDLPAGRYTLTIDKPGYVATEYGAKRPTAGGVPIVVAAGEQAAITVRLPRGSVITGTVRGPDGEPAPGVRMQLYQYVPDPNGGTSLTTAIATRGWRGSQFTDDLGNYRFYGLPPGEYFVGASPQGGGSGRLLTAADFDWVQRLIRGAVMTSGDVPPAAQSASYATVFFPGAIDPAGAAGVSVATGETRAGVDVAVQYVPTATISGVVLDPAGFPPQVAQGNLVSMLPGFVRSPAFIRPDQDGRFTISGIVPGEYVLAVRGSAHDAPAAAAGPAQAGVASSPTPFWALRTLSISGRDLADLAVNLQPGMTLSGRLVFDATTLTPPTDATRIRVTLSPVATPGQVSMGANDAMVKADGTFEVPGVTPGRYRLTATYPAQNPAAPAWTLRSSMVNGTDTLDYPIDIRANESVSGAVITFTDRASELTGTLFDAAGKPAPQYFIVVFSTDRAFWMPQSRRVRSARPGNTGSYRIAGVPPGEYYVCALTDLESNLLTTPGYLEPLIASSMKITLGEGEKKVQDLKLAGGGQ